MFVFMTVVLETGEPNSCPRGSSLARLWQMVNVLF